MITISICTRNRENDLCENINSLVRSIDYLKIFFYEKFEVIIIDDGSLSEKSLKNIEDLLKYYNIDLIYIKKSEKGLYRSRILSLDYSNGDIIFFFDDDVIIDEKYFYHILKSYKNDSIGGVSGIDINAPSPSKKILFYQKFFLHSSKEIGKLSISYFNGSIVRWRNMKEAFNSEFFSGCNMSFRKNLLMDLPRETIFNNYSLGEDIFISHFASKKLKLLVEPSAKVYHKLTNISRDPNFDVARSTIINHYFILNFFRKENVLVFLFIWSCVGIIFKELYDILVNSFLLKKKKPSDKFDNIKGYFSGLIFIFKELLNGKNYCNTKYL